MGVSSRVVGVPSEEASAEREVELVARALCARGSVREAIAMLRGAVTRDAGHQDCRTLLDAIEGGDVPAGPGTTVELDLPLVDRWIRAGALVEALALLGGTPMGSLDTGREWANLLGELLAPVPVDAEETLVAMHHQLLSGGASVALTLLEEREREAGEGLPAWASRRLELLRWMLLDNAAVAESYRELPTTAPSALAGALRDPLGRRNVPQALEAARAFCDANPGHEDAHRACLALEAIAKEIEVHSGSDTTHSLTIPMYGLPAAAMQLRMGNLDAACSIYRKLEGRAEGAEATRLLEEVEALQRALAGEPVERDSWTEETTQLEAPPDDGWPEESEEATLDGLEAIAPSTTLDPPRGVDMGPTTEMPDAAGQAERLVAQGRLEEAEKLLRALAGSSRDGSSLLARADAIAEMRAKRDSSGVLVRQIKPVK